MFKELKEDNDWTDGRKMEIIKITEWKIWNLKGMKLKFHRMSYQQLENGVTRCT